MNVQLPDGTVVEDIPDGISQRELAVKLKANGMNVPDEWLAGQEVTKTEAARRGLVSGGGRLIRGLGILGAAPIARVAEAFGNTEIGDKLFAAADDFAKWGDESAKPVEGEQMSQTAKGVQRLAGAVPALAGMAAMGPVSGAVMAGGGSGADTYASNLEQGVDNETALKQAALAAGTNAASLAIPAAIPGRLALRLLSGGAANAVTSEAQREAANKIYEEKYPQMQQDFSPGEFAADMILGAAIGGVAGKPKAKTKADATPAAFPADKMQDLGDGNYRAPNGAPITKEMWESSTQRSRDGWMKEAPAEEKIPAGEATELSAGEAAAKLVQPDTTAIDKVLEKHPTGPIAEAAKAAKAKKIKAAEAAAKKAKDQADAADLRRAAAEAEDPDFKAELLARAEKLDKTEKIPVGEVKEGQPGIPVPNEKIPVGEVKEGQPDIAVPNEKVPVGEVTGEYPAGHTPVVKEVAVKPAEPVPAGEARELYADPNREGGPIPKGEATEVEMLPVGEVKEGQPDIPVTKEKIPVGEAAEMIPTGEATEIKKIPTGRATELQLEKQNAPGKIPKQEGVRQERGQGNEGRQTAEAGAGDRVQRAAQGERKGASEETLDLGLPKIDEAFMREQERVAPRGAEARAAAAPTERGRRHVRAEMDRAVAEGRLDKDVAATAAWALDKNPNLAAGLKLQAGGEAPVKGARGAYDDAHRVVEAFKGTKDPKTLAHEIFHHSERMMPQKVQEGIRREWRRRIQSEIAKTKDPITKAALADIPRAMKGDVEARERVRDAVRAGKLEYSLYDPSEFWAVNAARILNERHGSRNAWHTQARQWLREMIEHVKSTIGLRSDAPVLKALDEVLNPKKTTGVDRSPTMLKKAAEAGDDRSFALAPNQKGLPEETKGEARVRKVFDSQKRTQTAQEVSGITDEKADMRLAVRLNLGRIQGRMEKFHEQHTEPLTKALKAAKKAGVTVRDADDYVTALHAPERNAVIMQRDPTNKAGSGYTDPQAADVIASFTPEQIKHLDKIAGIVRKINHEKLDAMVDDGLITPETRDALNKQFKNYVPLKNLDEEAKFTGAGRGYQTWANDIVAATGRTSRAGSPISATLMDATRAIARGERARVNKVIWEFANRKEGSDIIQPYDPDNPPPSVMKAELDKNGKKHMVVDRGELDAQTISLVVDGHPKKVFVSDPALKEALATAGTPQQIGDITRAISKGTRAFSRTLTEWNVAFAPVNQVKDVITSAIRAKRLGLSSLDFTPEKIVRAQAAVINHMRGKRTGDAAVYEEMINAGGKTGGYGLTNLADTMASLEKMGADLGYEDHKGGVGRKIAKVAGVVGDGLSNYNEVFEYSTRLAAYKAARAKGMTPKRAAEVARKITVDFNVSGELGRRLGHIYAFANAALQGLHGDVLDLKSPKTRYRMLAMVALGAAVQVYNETYGGTNEETGDLNVDSQADASLDSSVTLLGPDSRSGVKIPLPPGLATGLYTLGRRLARLSQASGAQQAAGQERNMEREATGILSAAVQSVMPVRFAEGASQVTNVLQGLTPALIRPAVDVSVNSNQFGVPIVPTTKDTRSPPPAYMLSRHNTSEIAKEMSKFVNDLTGGDDVRPGASQKYLGNFVAPEAIEHLVGYYTGGVGQLAMQSKNIVKNAVEDKPQDVNKIPVARRFAFTEPESYTSRRFRELQEDYEYAKDYQHKEQSAKIAPRIQASLEQYLEADKELSVLFKELRGTKEDAQREQIQQQIKAVQSRVIKAYNQTGK